MRVTVRLFAGYRERAGTSQVDLELPEGSTVGHMSQEMLCRYPEMTSDADRIVVAVNQEYQEHGYTLTADDEVALIPPVSGGCEAL